MRSVPYGFMVFSNQAVPRVVELVKLGEELGFDSAWLLDSQLVGREAFVAMTACALNTRRIKIGPGVTHTVTRHPSVIASGFASLVEVAPGRINLAVGFGDSAIRGLGGKPAKLAKYREDFEVIRRLLAGERIPYNGREIKLAWSDPELTRQIQMYAVPGNGPKGLALAGELGQGVVLHCEVHEIKAQLNIIAEGAARLGKTLKDLRIIWWPTASIDEDWGKVREHLTARMASTLRHAYYDYKRGAVKEDEMPVPVEFARRIAEEYNFLEHATAEAHHGKLLDQVPDKVFKQVLAGSPEEVAPIIRQTLESYPEIEQVVLHIPVGTGRLSVADVLRNFTTKVRPLLN
jgi:5,10-methylenetetrahydromethanopterin reductase